jgi:hypothetical protein
MNVPPESQGDGKSSSTLQQTISNCHCKGRSRDYMGNGHFPFGAGIRLELVAKKSIL